MNSVSCGYAHLCAGCDFLYLDYEKQKSLKERHLRDAFARVMGEQKQQFVLPIIKWVEIAPGGLRDRVDFSVSGGSSEGSDHLPTNFANASSNNNYRVGLFSKHSREIVDLEGCPQMSSMLESWYQQFRSIKIPVERGSVRLRVSPSGARGVWLDLANLDVKRLLDERTTLIRILQKGAIVEIGQRRKRLVDRDDRLRLDDAQLAPWFETYSFDDIAQAIPLYCTIGGFTQPGFKANHALVSEVARQVSALKIERVAEFGSGIGNFTIPLARYLKNKRGNAAKVFVYELDQVAATGLKRSAIEQGLENQIEIRTGNFQLLKEAGTTGNDDPTSIFKQIDLVLVDPPRSGLMGFLDPLARLELHSRPSHFVYISCFSESFAADALKLDELGYVLTDISIVDQFPQSRHYEIVSTFSRTGL